MRTIWQNAIRLKAVSRQALAVAAGLLLAANRNAIGHLPSVPSQGVMTPKK